MMNVIAAIEAAHGNSMYGNVILLQTQKEEIQPLET
jgi:hypothetical protein